MSSSDQPPPYPGYPEPSGQNSYPPPNSAYPPGPYDPTKAPQGYNQPGQPAGGYAQPAGGYSQQTGGYSQPFGMQANYNHGTTVVVAQPAVTVIQTFREVPVHTNCPHCRAEVVTGTHYESGTFTWLFCCVLWFVGCGLGCCLIPFCVDGCKDVIHTCPNCRQQIARFSRL